MKLLDDYRKIEQAIFDYFGYKEDWVTIPLEDRTDMSWQIVNGEAHGGEVKFHETMEAVRDETGEHYCNEIYTQRFLPKWVYRGEDYTMICVDTHTDGNKFLAIFDNSKEIK